MILHVSNEFELPRLAGCTVLNIVGKSTTLLARKHIHHNMRNKNPIELKNKFNIFG